MKTCFSRRSWIFVPGLILAIASIGRAQTLSPPSFGPQVEGTTSAPQTATLRNSGTVALTITKISVTGNFAQASGGTCPMSPAKLAKGATCTILVTFSPPSTGTYKGTLSVTDNAANSPQTANLSGSGILPVTVTPGSMNFGKLPLGETSAAKTVTVTNNQSIALNFSSIGASGDFAVASNTCGASLLPNTSCTLGVTFTPTATGSRTGTLTIADDAGTSPQTVSLTGSGAAAVLVSISVTPANPTLYVGLTQQFTATGTYSNNTTKTLTNVTWSVSPLGFASISTSGLATALAAGSTTVSATLGSVTGSTLLTVVAVFVPTGSLNTARYYHSATMLDNGSVLFAGGIGPVPGGTGALGELNSAELYNPGTGVFTFTGNLNVARDEHTATLLNNGTVLIAGGSGGYNELASAEIYNPATATFILTTGSLNTARYEHTATLLPDGTVLLAGGYGAPGVLGSAEIYNPATQTFTVTTGSLNNPRFDATATLLPNGTVLIAGGADANGPLASAEIYTPATQTFTLSPNGLNVARSSATANLLNTGSILIADGYNYLTTGPLTSAELYNPSTGTFTLTGSETTSSYLGAVALVGNGTVILAGSVYNSADAQIYNPSNGSFTATSALPTAGDLQTATLLPSGAVLIAGGHSNINNTVLAAAELFDPQTLYPANLSTIALTPANPTIVKGASQQLVATGTFTNNSTQVLASATWTSSNPAVATVTNDVTNSGVVYGAASGTAVISACTGTICGTATVTVP